jgi:hypothetical protein
MRSISRIWSAVTAGTATRPEVNRIFLRISVMVENPHDMPVGIEEEKALLKAQSCIVENHRAWQD